MFIRSVKEKYLDQIPIAWNRLLSLQILLFILISCVIVLSGCKQKTQTKKPQEHIITASAKSTVTKLYYSGKIQPLSVSAITSPTDGQVLHVNFQYGHAVTKGQILLTISSEKLQKDYRTALTNFLKAKDDYDHKKSSFIGTTELWKAGIIYNDAYSSEKSTLEGSELAYLNAREVLLNTAKEIPGMSTQLTNLSLENFSEVKNLLSQEIKPITRIAPISGVALFPSKGADSGGKAIHIGSQVKQGQVLLTIGNLKGISIDIQVSGMHINQIKAGNKATVTSPDLPNIILQGKVTSVAAQAQSAGGSGSSAKFSITIIIPTLTKEQLKFIRVGMDAQAELEITNPPQIVLPLKAVLQKKEGTFVTVVDAKGRRKNISVKTGRTTLNNVTILSGVKPGDKVVVYD